MKNNLKFILPVCVVLLFMVLLALWFSSGNDRGSQTGLGQKDQGGNWVSAKQGDKQSSEQARPTLDPMLLTALAEMDPEKRKELLEQWAKSVGVDTMADTLARMESIPDGKLKSEARAALLGSWSDRDLGGEVKWFGDRGGADGLHQQARDVLAQAMADRDPAAMLDWMKKSMPESSRKELYIPICQQWMSHDPSGTATLLRRMIVSSTADAANPAWIDLAGQVAAQWSNTDVNSAVSWSQSLPKGPARERALGLVSGKWAETNPQGAAAYAIQENDPQLVRNVAAKWAESSPQAAAIWAKGLPAGETGTAAILSIVPMWTQKDPAAAAAYAINLPQEDVKNQAVIAVASAWAYNNPAQAKAWVSQFPSGSLREQAMQQVKLIAGK
ncbi:MAG: hypothetical protein PHD76_14220 [Methylacidiphilales bacterium]|nr:hypothetical protein [Candidatus Methylacidiphilales bacterium]